MERTLKLSVLKKKKTSDFEFLDILNFTNIFEHTFEIILQQKKY